MPERKLASIQVIGNLEPIEGADRILKARIMGWDVVVAKGEFNIGDKCVFCEVAAILPDGVPWAEFMRPRKFRVKTVRLRGVLSQGLALPLSILPTPNVNIDDAVTLGTSFMTIQTFDELLSAAQASGPRRMAVAAAHDPRVLVSVDEAQRQGIATAMSTHEKVEVAIPVQVDQVKTTEPPPGVRLIVSLHDCGDTACYGDVGKAASVE